MGGSSKWRSGGAQTEKIGFTPNNIDFVFYNRRFFKALGVLAYPNWEEEDLEACNLPGYKYPSDHFAHMALFEERDVHPAQALMEEMYHLVKRNHVTPAHNKEVRNDAGKLERTDYRFYFPDVKAALAEVSEQDIVETFYKYRSYLRRSDEDDWATLTPPTEDQVVRPEALAGRLAEVIENLDAAKALWVRKFIRKTKRKKHFAADRAEWSGENLRNYDLTGRELEMMSQEALLGAFSDAQNIQQGQLIDHILQGLRQPQAPQQAPVAQPMRNRDAREEEKETHHDQVVDDNNPLSLEPEQANQLRRRLMEQ